MFARLINRLSNNGTGEASRRVVGASASARDVAATQDSFDNQQCIEIDRAFTCMLLGVDLPVEEHMSAEDRSLLATLKSSYLDSDNPENLLPRMPSVIPKAMQMMRSSDVNVENLAQLLSGDIVISGEIIKLSNSAYYARGRELTSLEQAIFSIGFEGMRQILISVLMKPILGNNRKDLSGKQASLWDTSMRIALMSDSAASLLDINRFHAYSISMLSPAGIAIMLQLLYRTVDTVPARVSTQFIDEFNRLASSISIRVGKDWDFPGEVTNAQKEMLSAVNPHDMSRLAQIAFYSDSIIKLNILNCDMNLTEGEDYRLPDIPADIAEIYSQLGAI